MEITLHDEGRVTVVSLFGDLVIGDPEAEFKRTIGALLEAGKVDILVDCRSLKIVDSSGLGALVRALTTSQHEGGQTKLFGIRPGVKKVLDLTRLGSVFEIFDDRDLALSSF